jgi:hypothetical protein
MTLFYTSNFKPFASARKENRRDFGKGVKSLRRWRLLFVHVGTV